MTRDDRLRGMDVATLERASAKLREVAQQAGKDAAASPGAGWDAVFSVLLDDVLAVIAEKRKRAAEGEL